MSAMPAEAEPVPGSSVRPLPARPVTARKTSTRLRSASARSHPVGVRACSSVSSIGLAESDAGALAMVLPIAPQRTADPAEHEARRERTDETQQLRLTSRGRSVIASGLVVAATLLWFAIASTAHASDHGTAPAPHPAAHAMSQVIVQPGQTLWSIAVQADPSADTRLVVQRIVTANALTSESITAGQHLWVPTT